MTLQSAIITAYGFIFTILLGIIAYFLKQSLKEQKENTKAIQSLEIKIGVSDNEVENINQRCITHRETTNKTLKEHSEMLVEHETKIAVINSKLNINNQ
jgi:uncharacterized coiled-coil protein SlyX